MYKCGWYAGKTDAVEENPPETDGTVKPYTPETFEAKKVWTAGHSRNGMVKVVR
jgi:hypothetical protein